jgi:hypothetical protein
MDKASASRAPSPLQLSRNHVAVAVAREAHGPEAVDHGRQKSPSASPGVIPFGDLKRAILGR